MSSSPRKVAATAVARLKTGEQTARKIAALFANSPMGDHAAIDLVDNGRGCWSVAIHFRAPPDEKAVRALAAAAAGAAAAKALRFERVAPRDWVRESLAGLRPVEAGRFIVHGAHDRARVPPNRIGIEIEAALAFGTGHHGTTRGCLLALDAICKTLISASPRKGEGRGGGHYARHSDKLTPTRLACARRPPPFRGSNLRILDLGTGSGVLAIAAARMLRARVLATDIDAEAIRVAAANARRNGVGPLVEVVCASGVAGGRLRMCAPFDLVFANILLGPLQRFAAPLMKLIAPGGRIVLSGILTSQANAAISAYRPLALQRRIDLDGWTTLVFVRPCS
jgi:ribosomal protein L11 methyltransferase